MPYRNRYASANYIKATKPSKENMVQHYDSHELSLNANEAIYIPFVNTQPRDSQMMSKTMLKILTRYSVPPLKLVLG